MSWRPIRAFGVGTLCWLVFTACGGGSTPSAQSNLPSYMSGLSGVIHWNQSGGELQTGFDTAFVSQFEKLTGVKVVYSSPCCDYAKLQAMHESGSMQWDMMEVGGLGDLLALQNKGLVQKVDYSGIDISQVPSQFVTPYGYDYGPSGSILIWRTDVWPMSGTHPTSTLALFDTKDFPGKRCVYGGGPDLNGVLEYAEMAAGVPQSNVYPINLSLAFGELNKIRSNLVFWSSGAQSIQNVIDKQCNIGTTWNGRPAIRTKADPSLPIAGTYKGAMIGGGYFAIPTGAPNAKAANALMKYYLQTSVQASMCNAIAYCLNMPGVVSQVSTSMQNWTPLGTNLDGTFPEGGDYWASHLDCLTPVWQAWLSTGKYNGTCQ